MSLRIPDGMFRFVIRMCTLSRSSRRRSKSILALVFLGLFVPIGGPALADDEETGGAPTCSRRSFEGLPYVACTVDPRLHEFVLRMGNGQGGAATLNDVVADLGPDRVAFAMNAGMWRTQPSFGPVGLFVSDNTIRAPLSTADGYGNFHLKPNGVFLVEDEGARVVETEAFAAGDFDPDIATQSGPMLVIDGDIHPKIILPGGDSLKVRNAVGVTSDGMSVFVISVVPVSFGWLARLYRDELACPNALYLDGTVSSIYAPELGLTQSTRPFGPMIAAVRRP